MKKIKNMIAIMVCKFLTFASKLMGKKGSSGPGGIALKISPTLLKDLSSQIKGDIIMVCGTNGKTTTNNLIYSLLKSKGKTVVCNNVGANMLPGVACAFINMSTVFGRMKADCASIECDEASLRRVVPHVKPTMVVVTNLFRDQLDRYGEIEMTLGYLDEAIAKVPDVKLVLNGDDPVSVQLGKDRKCITFGVDENCNVNVRESKEGRFCLNCSHELSYNYYHYSQLGDYYCPNCGFKRPSIDYGAKNVSMTDGISFDIDGKIKTKLSVNYRGFYNIYNILASVAVLCECNESCDGINSVFDLYKPQIGRMESFIIDGKQTVLNLAKNPAGFNQAIATVMTDVRPKSVLIAVNDAPSDGRDVSWLWDVDFEKLKESNAKNIFVSGTRKHDLAVRLKYGGFENVTVCETSRDDLKTIISSDGDICYMLVNYTVLFETQSNLKALEGGKSK
ncbi:MAG: DUF1727 domain-containing protein [Clostridia bacterium]|nr:DUF1727 domain-containing protein [Clostridia bacterium]